MFLFCAQIENNYGKSATAALIPAHNEQPNIVAAIQNIRSHVDRIVVACDNCSDDTHKLAQEHGADTTIINPEVWFAKVQSLIYSYLKRISEQVRRLTPFQTWKLKHFHRSIYNELFQDRAYDCVGSIFHAPAHLPKHNFIEEGQVSSGLITETRLNGTGRPSF